MDLSEGETIHMTTTRDDDRLGDYGIKLVWMDNDIPPFESSPPDLAVRKYIFEVVDLTTNEKAHLDYWGSANDVRQDSHPRLSDVVNNLLSDMITYDEVIEPMGDDYEEEELYETLNYLGRNIWTELQPGDVLRAFRHLEEEMSELYEVVDRNDMNYLHENALGLDREKEEDE